MSKEQGGETLKHEEVNETQKKTDAFVKETLKDLSPEQKQYAADVLSNAVALAGCLVAATEKSNEKQEER